MLILITFVATSFAQEHRRYALVWHDEFNSNTLNERVWSKTRRSRSEWAMHMTPNEALYALDGNDLVLRGMVNDFLTNDTASVLTGGVWSRNKKSFGFGRLEIRAKFDVAQGYWPAIWMMPDVNQNLNWPHGGEIDIMEHFDSSPHVNHTIHSNYTVNLGYRNRPPQVGYPLYHEGEYNTYGVERFEDSLVFFVNGNRTFVYPRYRKGVDGQFPFSQHNYYLILDSQLGRKDGPKIDTTKLPVELCVDYVRYYEVDTKTDVIPEPKEYQQIKTKMKKLRRVVYNKRKHFDNPDEYHLVVKCGKAKISGNRQWAESTLAQLVDENGYIANLEIHDWATCPVRGISLEKCGKKLKYNDLEQLLNQMAFYKLNRLQWKGSGSLTEAEVEEIRNRAEVLGIEIVAELMVGNDKDWLEMEGNAQLSASSQVFLHTASQNGGWLYLKDLGKDDLKVMMAFAERYWQGGDAGATESTNGAVEAMSPAGSRLKNFNEKIAIHNQRFHQ